MKHYPTENGGHYAVSPKASGLGVLVQIMEGKHAPTGLGHQARELLTCDEAMHLADLLHDAVDKVDDRYQPEQQS